MSFMNRHTAISAADSSLKSMWHTNWPLVSCSNLRPWKSEYARKISSITPSSTEELKGPTSIFVSVSAGRRLDLAVFEDLEYSNISREQIFHMVQY